MDNSKKFFFTGCHVVFAIVVLLFINVHPVFSQDDDEDTYNPQYSSPFAQPKFVPNISLIMDFSYAYRDVRDEEYQQYVIPGLMDAHGSFDEDKGLFDYSDSAGRGFNLNYGELNLQSAVDPYFDLFANFTLEEEAFSVEELYFSTRGLPLDLQLKVGKFLSSFGRLNPQHEHFWDFNDLPVVYNAFFGDGIDEKGVQITWLAPFDFYLMIGGEILQGENETSFGNEGFTVEASGLRINRSREPNLYTGFIKTSLDTDDLIVLAGVSSAVGKARIENGVNDDADGFAIDACTAVYGADLTVKYLIDSYRYISLQGEYLYRDMHGSQYEFNGTRSDLEKKQSGLYAQLVVKPFLQWRFGVRYDLLHRNEVSRDDVRDTELPENTDRYAAMIEYNFTEFSRFRLQYNHDRTKYYADERKTVHEIVFACNLAIGAHGAHKF